MRPGWPAASRSASCPGRSRPGPGPFASRVSSSVAEDASRITSAFCPALAVAGTSGTGNVSAMTWAELLGYCLAKPGAWQDEPWEGDVVAKVGGKIFAFFGSGPGGSVGLKCAASREAADEWLLRY